MSEKPCGSGRCLGCTPHCEGDFAPVYVIRRLAGRPRAWAHRMAAKVAPDRLQNPDCIEIGEDSITIYRDLLRSNPKVVEEILDAARTASTGCGLELEIIYLGGN